jgi:microcystin-dependent protein
MGGTVQEFNTVDVLRLEVETDPTGLVNLVQNPSGELGGWGWITTISGSAMAGGTALTYSGVAGASWFTTEPMPVTAGQYVAARWNAVSGTPSGTYFRARFEWLDASQVLLSSSTQTGYLTRNSGVGNLGPIVAPASTAYVRLRFDLYANTSGGNPPGAHTFVLSGVTVAKAATSGALGSVRTNLVSNPSFAVSTGGWTPSGPSVVRTNLLTNPSFEVNAAGWAGSSANTSVARSTAQAKVGSASLAVTYAGPSIGIGVTSAVTASGTAGIPVTPGTTYTLTISSRAQTTGRSINASLDFYNSAGTYLTTVTTGSGNDTTTGWTDVRAIVTAPANAAYARVNVEWGGDQPPGEVHYLDAAILEQGNLPGQTYFDGSTAAGAGWTYAWTGTANASKSTATSAVTLATASPPGVPVGATALEITAGQSGTAGAVNTAASATAGRDYTVQAQLMSPTATGARLAITWRDASNAVVSVSTSPTTALTANTWKLATYTASAPVGATTGAVSVIFDTPGASAVYYADAVMLEAASSAGTYFDGNTASGGGITYAWTGTPNLSQSTATTSNLPFIEPVQYLNIVGEAHEMKVHREELEVGTLTALILSRSLDPAASALIRPGRRARLRALVSGTWETLITGTMLKANVTYDLKDPTTPDERRARIDVTIVDPAQPLANTKRPEGVGTIPELPFVLEGAGVPWNVNGSGNQVPTANVTTYNDSASALTQVALTRDSRCGYAWVSRIGVFNVWDAASLPASAPIVLDESDYSDLDVTFGTEDVINEVNVTVQSVGVDGTTVETTYGPYRDSTSIETWGRFKADFTVTGLDEAGVAALAAAILAANGTPQRRVNSVTLPLTTLARVNARALLDLYARVQVNNTELGLSAVLRVTGIEHVVDTEKWMLTLSFSRNGGVASPIFQPPVQQGVQPDVGVVEWYAGPVSKIPAEKLLCDGRSVPVASYPALFAVIGYTFGGSGASFNVPNLVDRFPIGAGTKALGTNGGSPTKTLTVANLPAHDHDQFVTANTSSGTGTRQDYDADVTNGGRFAQGIKTGQTGSGTAFDVMNPWLALNPVIRTGGPGAYVPPPAPAAYAAEVLADAPLMYFRLGESSGTVMTDSSGNNRNGTYSGGVTLGTPGALLRDSNTAATFNGTTGLGTVADTTDLTAVTFEAWIKPSSGTTGVICGRESAVSANRIGYIWMNGSKPEVVIFKNGSTVGSVLSPTSINDGQWHHVVGTYDGTTIRLYVDGVQVGTPSTVVSGALPTADTNFVIGGRNGAGEFNGPIDEVAYYTTALSAARVAAHYAARS